MVIGSYSFPIELQLFNLLNSLVVELNLKALPCLPCIMWSPSKDNKFLIFTLFVKVIPKISLLESN